MFVGGGGVDEWGKKEEEETFHVERVAWCVGDPVAGKKPDANGQGVREACDRREVYGLPI